MWKKVLALDFFFRCCTNDLTNQIAHQGFWIFNRLTLPLDSEDGFHTVRLSKRQLITTVLLRTPVTQVIFFNQGMLYPFKVRRLGTFLALRQQYRRMDLVFLVTPSQFVICTQNKHNQRERAFFFYRMPDSSDCFYMQQERWPRKWYSSAQNTLFNNHPPE